MATQARQLPHGKPAGSESPGGAAILWLQAPPCDRALSCHLGGATGHGGWCAHWQPRTERLQPEAGRLWGEKERERDSESGGFDCAPEAHDLT